MDSDVATKAPNPCGVWWYAGKDFEGNEHRIAVPVPASGVPREVADAARAAVVDNVPISGTNGSRFWELLGGIIFCAGCGLRMQAHVVRSSGRVYSYLRCPLNQRVGSEKCPVNARLLAEEAERVMWEFVVGLLVEPERIVSGLDTIMGDERILLRGDPERDMQELRRRLQDLDGRRERAQDAYLAGAFSVDELRGRHRQLEEAKEAILRELTLCENRGARLRSLLELRDRLRRRTTIWSGLLEEPPNLLKYSAEDSPRPRESDAFTRAQRQTLDNATPKQRRELYLSLRLRVNARSKKELEISGIFGREVLYLCHP